ncbi:MAG: PAS domain-containing sensor histidine kinase [Archaeoglobales archaeon]|nr:PAS domain-containing sensor histidine kinase [Archaeoglobales archaeon]
MSKKPSGILTMVFPLIWIFITVAWILIFPIDVEEKIDYKDFLIEGNVVIEGTIFLITLIFTFYIKRFPHLVPGWGIFVTGWLLNLLEKFTSEPEFFISTLEELLIALGLLLIFFGLSNMYWEVKNKYEQSKESLTWFKKLVEVSPTPHFVYTNGKFVYVNKAAEELTGYSKEELLKGIFWELFEDKEKDKVKLAMAKRLSGEKVEPYTLKIKRKDGDYRIVQVYGTYDVLGDEKYGILSLADVTKLEEERKRNEELSRMLSLINKILRHDVINALTSAVMYMEIFKETGDISVCDKVKNSVERAINIVKNLKSFEETIKTGKLKIMKVREVVEDVARGFSLPIEIEGDCEVVADDGLKTVFENLFQNAVQHAETSKIEVKIRKTGEYCEIRVADFGKGISDEIKPKIFDEGFSYGEKASTGLGLFVVRKLVEKYNGEVWVEDNKPKGAVFVLKLRTA